MKYKLVQWIKDQWFEVDEKFSGAMSLEDAEKSREFWNESLQESGWKYSERRYAIRPCT